MFMHFLTAKSIDNDDNSKDGDDENDASQAMMLPMISFT